jgi:hypothetical protein
VPLSFVICHFAPARNVPFGRGACFIGSCRPSGPPDKVNITLERMTELIQGCKEFRQKGGRYPTCGAQIVFFFRDTTDERVRDGFGNPIQFTTNSFGGLMLDAVFEFKPGKTSYVSAYLEP